MAKVVLHRGQVFAGMADPQETTKAPGAHVPDVFGDSRQRYSTEKIRGGSLGTLKAASE